jgi:hypothetical protein
VTNTYFARLLAGLLLVSACSEDAQSPDSPTDDTDEVDAEEGDGDEGGKLDAGNSGKMDASVPVAKPDASVDGGSKPDAALAPDSGAKPDAAVKPDAATPDAGGPVANLKPKCVKKPSQVMVIGDSYINWISHTFPQDLDKLTGGGWRMEAIGAYSMGSGGIGSIPSQYDLSIALDPDAHTILMDGGGNDILVADPTLDFFGDCKTEKSATLMNCQTIVQKALDAADSLLQRASKAGIRDVVYFFYPHVPEGTALGGPKPNVILDYALPKVRDFCDGVEAKTGGKTRCTFIDLVPVFEGHPEWFVEGDIHENSDGSKQIAQKVWDVMRSKCIAQPEASGCCEP